MSLTVERALRKAQSHIKAGELAKAEELYKQILPKFPKNKKVILGYQKLKARITSKDSSNSKPPQEQIGELVGLYNQRQFEEVLAKIKPLVSLFPNAINLHNIQAVSNAALQRYDAAIDSYKQVIMIKPDYAEAYYNMGITLDEKGELDAAIDSYKKAIEIKSDYAGAYYNMGNALKAKGELDAAIDNYKQAIKIKPDYAEAYYNMSITLDEKGELDAAIDSYKKAIEIKSDYAGAYYNMGNALKAKGELDAAIDSYKQAIKIKPDYRDAYNNMGVALMDKDELDAAIDSYKQAINIKLDYAEAYSNLGLALNEKGELDAAIESCKQAIKIKPDCAEAHYNSCFALLNSGRLKEGLDVYEWRWKTAKNISSQRHFLQPLWDGKTSLQDKRILVWCEQGVGDTIVWSSRLSLLVSQAGYCILECQAKLVPLLSRSFPNVEVKPVDVSRDTQRDDFDFHLPMASLYRHFIAKITQISRPDAFLIPDPVRIKFWKDCLSSLGSGPYVGISWKSSQMGAERSKHFSSLSECSSLLKLPNINFINLQDADAADGLLQIQNEFGVKVHNFDDLDQYNNLDDVAALSAALDCVVSFATSVPMIAAGVGTLTKCALRANGDYNNILGGPVGPLVDKFEKNTWQSWSNVLGLIAEDIAKL